MNPVRQVLKQALTAVLPPRWWLTRGPRACGLVALTFDDGPHPEYTPALLDMLHAQQVRATFFVVGREAARYPDVVRRMLAEGHDVGCHTYSHSDPSQTSAAALREELRACRTLLAKLGVAPCRLFRPPLGKLTARKIIDLWQMQHSIVLWNIDPRDYRLKSPDEIAAWCAGYAPQGGDIVLLHDNRPGVLTAVPRLIQQVLAQGLGFQRISAWTGPLPTPGSCDRPQFEEVCQ